MLGFRRWNWWLSNDRFNLHNDHVPNNPNIFVDSVSVLVVWHRGISSTHGLIPKQLVSAETCSSGITTPFFRWTHPNMKRSHRSFVQKVANFKNVSFNGKIVFKTSVQPGDLRGIQLLDNPFVCLLLIVVLTVLLVAYYLLHPRIWLLNQIYPKFSDNMEHWVGGLILLWSLEYSVHVPWIPMS